jgi:hypothetical protein
MSSAGPEPTGSIPRSEPQPRQPCPDRDADSQQESTTGAAPDGKIASPVESHMDATRAALEEPKSADFRRNIGEEDPADTAEKQQDLPEDEPIPAVLTAASADSQQPPQSRNRRASVGLIAALVVGATMIAVAVLILARDPIVAVVPGAAKIYGLVGLSGEELGAGLDIRDVRSTREPTGDSETLVIEGIIANTSNGPRNVPLVRVALFDADNEELQFVTVSPDQLALPPGETIDFMARLDNPAATARRIKVTFAPRDESS